MSERDTKIKIIEEHFKELIRKIDKFDRYNYYFQLNGRKRPALVVMELYHTGNGYINGKYVNTQNYKTTKHGDINIKNFSEDEIIKLIKEAINNIS